MALSYYTVDLVKPVISLLSEQQSRTLIGVEPGREPSKANKVGVAYMHNVMPTSYGMKSVGYLSVADPVRSLPTDREILDTRIIYSDQSERVHIAWDTVGKAYILYPSSNSWITLPSTVPSTESDEFVPGDVTTATVNGITYIYYRGKGCFTFNSTLNTLDRVVLSGLSIDEVIGVVGSSGYLLAYTAKAIAWSSTLVPTDFVPSSETGAGGGNVAGIAGNILFCSDNPLGVLVYSDTNAVSGVYTGNKQFPFKFREVDNSKGGLSEDSIAYEANSRSQYVYSKAGLQSVNSQVAENLLPEVTDFLAGGRIEDFNETTKQYEVTTLTSTLNKKIKYIASRYLVISYGVNRFSFALVYDTALSMLGKLKIDHTDVFEYIGTQKEVSKQSLAFLLPDGEVKVTDFARSSGNSEGVIILGKLQATRTRLLTVQTLEFENVNENSDFSVSLLSAVDGKNTSTNTGIVSDREGDIVKYSFRATAKNHSIVCIGKFDLTTALLTYTQGGRR